MWTALRWATATAFGMSFSIVAVLGIDAIVGPLDARALGLATLMVMFITVILTQRFLASLDQRPADSTSASVDVDATSAYVPRLSKADSRV